MNTISNDLANLITTGLIKTPLPIKKGNSIIIGKVVIRYNRNTDCYHIFDTQESTKICTAETKHAAICIAKLALQNKPFFHVLRNDKMLSKLETDAMFYENTVNKTTDLLKKDTAEIRLDVTYHSINTIKQKLEEIIFSH